MAPRALVALSALVFTYEFRARYFAFTRLTMVKVMMMVMVMSICVRRR